MARSTLLAINLEITYRSLLNETGAPIGVQQKLMRLSNVATTMNVHGNATLKAKQKANSKVVQMVIPQPRPQPEPQAVAVQELWG